MWDPQNLHGTGMHSVLHALLWGIPICTVQSELSHVREELWLLHCHFFYKDDYALDDHEAAPTDEWCTLMEMHVDVEAVQWMGHLMSHSLQAV